MLASLFHNSFLFFSKKPPVPYLKSIFCNTDTQQELMARVSWGGAQRFFISYFIFYFIFQKFWYFSEVYQ